MDIQGRCIVVSGGASGLGAATVEAIVSAGGNAIIADIRRDPAADMMAEYPDQIAFSHTDVTDSSAVQKAMNAAVTQFGGLHGVVNCAGIGIPAKVLSKDGPMRLDFFTKVIHINLIGTFNMIRLAAEKMVENEPDAGGERGIIINTASVAAYEGQIGQAAYSASKGGVIGMTLPIARELARSGVRVNTIAPGLFMTPMMAQLPEAARDSLGAQVPFPSRLGKPEEYSSLVMEMIRNTMFNGETVRLDGAIRMAPK